MILTRTIDNSHRNNLRSKYYLNFPYFKLAFSGAIEQKQYDAARNYCFSYLSRLTRVQMIRPDLSTDNQSFNIEKILGVRKDGYSDLGEIESPRLNMPKIVKRHQLMCEEYESGLDFYPVSLAYLTKINQLIEKADAKNIRLIFIKPPLNEGILPLYCAIETPYKMDISSPYSHPELYDFRHLHDWGHLNAEGARIFTEITAKKFQQMGD